MCLLLNVLSEIECSLLKLGVHFCKDDDNAKEILKLDDKCAICTICFNEHNCSGSSCKHCRVAKDKIAPLTIVIDSLKGANPCAIAEKRLKVLADVIVEEVKMDDVSVLSEKICSVFP